MKIEKSLVWDVLWGIPMSELSPDKIHYRIGDHYLCNGACYITEAKCTNDPKKVTCKNCLREIKKGRHKKD